MSTSAVKELSTVALGFLLPTLRKSRTFFPAYLVFPQPPSLALLS
jgi:hypothetical protein